MTSKEAAGRVTQRVSLADVEDLLARPARAAIAYVGSDGPEAVPVVVRRDDGIHIGMHPDQRFTTDAPERVVLVMDDGAYWFELRAAVWRGTVAPEGDDGGLVWFRLDPARVVAWDYARLHEEPAP